MSTPAYFLGSFPDVEVMVMDGLEAAFPTLIGRVATETPADLQTRLETGDFVRVGLVTGSDNRFTNFSVVDIDVFSRTRQGSHDLAELIRAWLLGYPLTVGTATIDRVVTETAPFQAPWEDENVRRRLATYRISTRR